MSYQQLQCEYQRPHTEHVWTWIGEWMKMEYRCLGKASDYSIDNECGDDHQ